MDTRQDAELLLRIVHQRKPVGDLGYAQLCVHVNDRALRKDFVTQTNLVKQRGVRIAAELQVTNLEPVKMCKPIHSLEMNDALPAVDPEDILDVDFLRWTAVDRRLDDLAVGLIGVHSDPELESPGPE